MSYTVIVPNKKALFDYSVLENFEAGLKLSGPEVKSVKKGQINLRGAYIEIHPDLQAYLLKAKISPYAPASLINQKYHPERPRKLLLKKKELRYLFGRSRESGLTLIPLKIINKNGLLKIEIALCRGRKKYDKREVARQKDFSRRRQKLLRHP